MLKSQISIMGMYDYNPEVFSGFEVPDGLDKEIAITEICIQCAELELIYPQYNMMKLAISNWTQAELPQWIRALEDMTIKYNPIWNVDGTEVETIERELEGNLTNTNESHSIDSSKAYNDNSFTERDKQDGTGKGISDNKEKETITTTRKRGGNIGVTMTQQMLNADLDILPRLNPYQYIVDSFMKRFCLLVY